MCQKGVRKQNGLGVLKVCAPGHDRGEVLLGLLNKSVDQAKHFGRNGTSRIEQIHARERCNLIVAAAARSNSTTQVGSDLGNKRILKSSVNVLISFQRDQFSRLKPRRDSAVPRDDVVALDLGEEPCAAERSRVGNRRLNVVGRESPIKMCRFG